jgi:hypothetical protein
MRVSRRKSQKGRAECLFAYLGNVSDGVVVTEKTVVILLPEFTEPGIGVNGPDIVVFKDLRKVVSESESVRVAPINEPHLRFERYDRIDDP